MASAAPSPLPASGVQCEPGDLSCNSTYTVDAQVLLTFLSSFVLGTLCVIGFCAFHPFISVWRGRLLAPQVAIKPPTCRRRGFWRHIYWLHPTLCMSERDLLATAGMDALVFERLIVLGLQFFTPVTIACCAILLPVHSSQDFVTSQPSNGTLVTSSLMQLTMSNIDPESPLLWIHCVMTFAITLYAMWLLWTHYKWYVLLRQHYLTTGDSVAPWLGASHAGGLSDEGGRGEESGGGSEPGGGARERPPEPAGVVELGGASPALRSASTVECALEAEALLQSPLLAARPAAAAQATLGEAPDQARVQASPPASAQASRTPSTRALLLSGSNGRSDGGAPPQVAAAAHPSQLLDSLPRAVPRAGSTARLASAFEMEAPRADERGRPVGGGAAGGGGVDGWGATPWWVAATGDPLLDRPLVRVDPSLELAAVLPGGQQLVDWWEVAAPRGSARDACAPEAGPAPSLPGAPADADALNGSRHGLGGGSLHTAGAAAGEEGALVDAVPGGELPDLVALPGTILEFDRRAVLARKPSVRFRNTVSVHMPGGGYRSVHASNYAVLVTDVRMPAAALRGSGSATSDSDSDASSLLGRQWDVEAADRPPASTGPLQCIGAGLRHLGTLLCFRWPCLLSASDLEGLLSGWGVSSDLRELGRAAAAARVRAFAAASRADGGGGVVDGGGDGGGLGGGKLALVESVFSEIFPQDFHAVVPVRNHWEVDDLLRKWDRLLFRYLQSRAVAAVREARARDAGRATAAHKAGAVDATGDCERGQAWSGGEERPPAAPATAVRRRTAPAPEEASATAGGEDDGDGADRRRCWPFGCARLRPARSKDLVSEQRAELAALHAAVLAKQREVLVGPHADAFIVLFKTPKAAALAAHCSVLPQSLHHLNDLFRVQPAPGPEEVLWQTLWRPLAERREALWRTLPWYTLLYLVPTGIFAAAFNSLAYGLCNSSVSPSFQWFCTQRFLQFLVTVVVPFILLMVWQNAVVPAWLYKLELQRGASVSLSAMERSVLRIYFGWELANLFLGGVMASSVLSQVAVLIENPQDWVSILGSAFPNSSNFFLNYVTVRALLMNPWRLLMPHGGMWRWLGQAFASAGGWAASHAVCERYRAMMVYPASIRYGREPGLVLLIFLIGVSYCVAAPLITPAVLAYMASAYVLWRYQILYVCVRCYESGGRMWPVYCTSLCWCLALFVGFTACMLLLKQANVQGCLTLLLLPTIFYFRQACRARFHPAVDSLPLWLMHAAPRTAIDPAVYTPPALRPGARGWFFEVGKAWVRWGVPLVYPVPS